MNTSSTAVLTRSGHPQSESIPGWLGVLDIAGRKYLVQGWIKIQSVRKAKLSLEFSRRMGGVRLIDEATLVAHPDKRCSDEPDLFGKAKLAEREWAIGAWMSRDQNGEKTLNLKLVARGEEGSLLKELVPNARPRPRADVRLPARPRPM